MKIPNLLLLLSTESISLAFTCNAFSLRPSIDVISTRNSATIEISSTAFSSSSFNSPNKLAYLKSGNTLLSATSPKNEIDRRSHISKVGSFFFHSLLTSTLVNTPEMAMAKTGQIKTAQFAGKTSATKPVGSPKEGFEGLIKARNELLLAQTKYVKKKDMEGLRSYLSEDVTYISSFESYALSILASKMLSDEDKKEIGTIRRYGIGADVMIMYGGLMAEIDEMNDEPDPATVSKYLGRTLDSLNEVIQICKNNGFTE